MATYTPEEITAMAAAALQAAATSFHENATPHAILDRADTFLEWMKEQPL
jgi:hypothetical protein